MRMRHHVFLLARGQAGWYLALRFFPVFALLEKLQLHTLVLLLLVQELSAQRRNLCFDLRGIPATT